MHKQASELDQHTNQDGEWKIEVEILSEGFLVFPLQSEKDFLK